MKPTADDRYHHGDLHLQLRLAAAQLIAERGPAGFSLREVARRAGVSHAAPAHHFGDATGLLTAVAIDALQHLHAAVTAAAEGIDDPRDRLRAMARAYVEISLSSPGHCAVAFRKDLVTTDDPDYQAAADAAHGLFFAAVGEIIEATNSGADIGVTTSLGWSAMQGLIELYDNIEEVGTRHGQGPVPPIGELAELFAEMITQGAVNS